MGKHPRMPSAQPESTPGSFCPTSARLASPFPLLLLPKPSAFIIWPFRKKGLPDRGSFSQLSAWHLEPQPMIPRLSSLHKASLPPFQREGYTPPRLLHTLPHLSQSAQQCCLYPSNTFPAPTSTFQSGSEHGGCVRRACCTGSAYLPSLGNHWLDHLDHCVCMCLAPNLPVAPPGCRLLFKSLADWIPHISPAFQS